MSIPILAPMPPRRRPLRAGVVLLATLLALTGCAGGEDPASAPSSPAPGSASSSASPGTDCDDVRATLVGAVQDYVDLYGPALSKGGPGSGRSVGGDDQELRTALATAQRSLQQAGCDLGAFREAFVRDLEDVTARGPLARAVLLRLTASLTGTLGQAAETVRLRPGDDLARELSRLAPGSTARLAAGTYRLRAPLVLLSGVTVRGVGRDRTTVTSTAAGSSVLVLTGERTELRDLALRHTGRRQASVLTGGPSSSVVLTSARLAGARGSGRASAAGVGSAVTMTARDGEDTDRGTTLEVTDTELVDNTASGILLAGAHRASVRGAVFRDNAQCAVCFAGASSGVVRRSTFTDNAVGVAALDESRPGVLRSRFTGGQVAVQASGTAAPVLRGLTVEGTARAAMIFGGRSRGRVDDTTCRRTPYGVVVTPKALPFLGDNRCDVARAGG